MKRIILAISLVLLLCGTALAFEGFEVYTDRWAPDNHYIPSGWMGDYNDMVFNDGHTEGAYSGKSCIKISYSAQGAQGGGWVGMYWQNPANNWGERDGGFDLTGAKALTFWAKGEKGGEVITEFKMGGISGEYGDSDTSAIGPVVLTNEWKKYSIGLEGVDVSYISGGFCWSASKNDNPEGFTVYLDEIRYE